jgi:ferric-dicitrate binding protein FerR (iron transport regulator)
MQQPPFTTYLNYQIEDFLRDDYFQQWIISPKPKTDNYWQEFTRTYPHQRKAVKEARKLLESIQYKPYSLPKEKQEGMLQKVYSQSASTTITAAPSPYLRRYLAIAASISIVILFSLYWLVSPTHERYETGFQETETIILPDGSEVTLNANTTVRVAINTEKNQPREVWLEGEAYFHVKHLDEDKTVKQPNLSKFVVHTTNFDIEVLGTTFNASSRPTESEVLLKEGSIKVVSSRIGHPETLESGDQLALSEEDNEYRIKKLKDTIEPAWRENLFVFENTPLKEVAAEIENYYGKDVVFSDASLAEKIFTAKVSRENLPMLLNAIETSFGLEIVSEKDKILIQY